MNLPDRKMLRLGHGSVSFREAGSGPALIVLHGLGGSSASWVKQYEGLSDTFRVIGWDAPGYGASDVLEHSDVDAYAGVLIALLDELGLDRVGLLGHSMGGVIAPSVVLRDPTRVRALGLSATRVSFAGDAAAGFAERVKELDSMSPAEFGLRRAESMVAAHAAPEVLCGVADIAAQVTPDGFRGGVELLAATDNRAILESLHIPTLAIAGELDCIAPPSFLEDIVSIVPDAQFVQLSGVAHAAYLEAALDYNALLRRFFLPALSR